MPTTNTKLRVIALEEAFLHPKLLEFYDPVYVKQLGFLRDKLTDVGPERIKRMDAAGIDLQVLSHVAPGVQTLEQDTAVCLAREINDWLGDIIQRYPTRFAGFASLATQSPLDAANELERTVVKFGFKGALLNGHLGGRYLDDEIFEPFLKRAEALDVPLYLHPFVPPEGITKAYYSTPGMAQGWGWMVDTSTHVLRLMANGTFDRHPRLKIIIGHMGELLPFNLERLNKGMTMGDWLLGNHSEAPVMQKSVVNYMRQNVFVTTSGSFDQAALQCTIAQLGIDNVLFSVDDPFADNIEGVEFLTKAALSDEDRTKLAHENAERILKLTLGAHTRKVGSGIGTAVFNFRARTKAKMAKALLGFLVK